MLLLQDRKEVILELVRLIVASTRHSDRFALTGCRSFLDEVLDVVVVDVVCAQEGLVHHKEAGSAVGMFLATLQPLT